MGIVDLSFDICEIAYSLAYILNTNYIEKPSNVGVYTHPFYNGRERNICITINGYGINKPIKSFHIIFGEYRNSDNIVVMTVKKEYFSINPLTARDMNEEDWNYKFFKYDRIYDAVDYIKNEIEIATSYFKGENNEN